MFRHSKILILISNSHRYLSTAISQAEQWPFVSYMLTTGFTTSYPTAIRAVTLLSEVAQCSPALILAGHIDHLTYNVTNNIHHDRIASFLKKHDVHETKRLVFHENAIDGTLFWLSPTSPFYRQKYAGTVSTHYKPGIQGLFIRFFQDGYLEEHGCGSLVGDDPGQFDIHRLCEYLHKYRPVVDKPAHIASPTQHAMLKRHFDNGTLGHGAIDTYSLGTSNRAVEEHVETHNLPFTLFNVKNPENTIRQLYLSEPGDEDSFVELGVENEPFVEFIEREVIDSVSAIGQRN